MKYNRKIKNKNIGYFMVGNRVFDSLRKAEKYCNANNLDVDECIISESQGILEYAKNISDSVLPLLYDIEKSIQKLYEKQLKVFKIKAEEYKESEHNPFQGLEKEYMNRSHGILDGISMVDDIIWEQIKIHKNVKNIYK